MQYTQNLISGLLISDNKIELFGCQQTKQVFFIQNGQTKQFNQLSNQIKANLLEMLQNDAVAMNDLQHLSLNKALEEFAFHCFGATDNNTDVFEDGTFGEVEANACEPECFCHKWNSKKVNVNGQFLTSRELQILSYFATDYADKEIAMFLHISQSTLDSHKTNLLKKFNVHGKPGLITQAIKQNIIKL